MENSMNNWMERIADSNKQLLESAARFNEITARAQGRLMRHQLTAFETYAEAGSKQLKLAQDVRDPQELFSKGTELSNELGEKITTIVRETFEIQAETQAEIAEWLGEEWKRFSQSVPAATKAATKSAKAKAA